MIRHTLRRLRRSPVPALGVLLFAVILSAVLCSLQKANDREYEKYQETYHAIPVYFSVTNLSGTNAVNLSIPREFTDLFTMPGGLKRYVTDLQLVCTHMVSGKFSFYTLDGITSTDLSPELWPENGKYITWFEGYDKSVLGGTDPVCLIPDTLSLPADEETGETYLELEFENTKKVPALEYECKLQVVGTYSGGGCQIFCPFPVCEQVFTELKESLEVQSIRATLANNDDLEELRILSKRWFAEPNPLGEKTPWGAMGYPYYPYALNIDDDMLQRTAETLQNSILTNRICTVVILCLSAAAGFLIGYLMIRSRKREISLMRTLGTRTISIYFGFALEQMLCYGLGIAIGGIVNSWEPRERLGILAAIYFVGLTTSLLIMLQKNLLSTMKEDE